MSNGAIQYTADTQLIEKLFLIESGLLALEKNAGLFDGFLSGFASSIMDEAKKMVQEKGVAGFILDLVAGGILTKLWPPLGAIYSVAGLLGFSPSKIVSSIMGDVKKKVDNGEEVTLSDVQETGKAAVAEEAGTMDADDGMTDPFEVLRVAEQRGELVRMLRTAKPDTASIFKDFQGWQAAQKQVGMFAKSPLLPQMNSPILSRVFGQLLTGPRPHTGKAKWLIGGFIIWVIKTALLGAGILGATAVAKKVVEKATGKTLSVTPAPGAGQSYENKPVVHLTPNGSNGQDVHANDHVASVWRVPLAGGSVESMLTNWAGYVYKELQGQGNALAQTPSFNKTVQDMMEHYYDVSDNQIEVPTQFKSIKQVVDTFANDVAARLPSTGST